MLATTCHNHPDRPAIAVCVSCRKSICQSCSTLWEGMHHCVDCLAARRAAKVSRGAVAASLALALLAGGLLFAATHLRAVIWSLVAGKLSG